MLDQTSASSLIHELAPRGGVQPELVSSSSADPPSRPDAFGSSAAVLSDIRDKPLVPALSPARTSTPLRVASALPIGIFFYLLSLGIVATATVGIFFGIGFFFLAQTTQAMNTSAEAREHGADSERRPSQVSSDEPSTYGDSASIPIAPPIARSAATAALPAAPVPVPLPSGSSTLIDDMPAGDAKVQSVSRAVPVPNASEASPSISPPAAQPAEAPGALSTTEPANAGAARLSAPQIAELLARGDTFLHAGDVVAARLFYERAADAGDWQAAIRMGATFDSAFLLRAGVRTAGDPIKAQSWYRHALDLGAPKTDRQLENPQMK